MKVVYIKERKPWGYVLSLVEVGRGISVSTAQDTLVIVGDETKEARLLKSAIDQFQRIAPVAGITRELKDQCERFGIVISSGWKVYHFPS
ncbi:MAG: hypothetical protein WC445_03450 [Patescibacteria group bacterium]